MKIGISGHQNLGSKSTVDWVREQFAVYLISQDCSFGVSSLAAGADQLFARAVLDLGRKLEVVIPSEGYEVTFGDNYAATEYRVLRSMANKCHVLDFDAPSEKAFYKAGCVVADLSDLMFVVWNGRPAGGFGGTADIVTYLKHHRRPFVWINPIAETVSQIPPETITQGR